LNQAKHRISGLEDKVFIIEKTDEYIEKKNEEKLAEYTRTL
jgi:hypothetical protein